jgi:hypothetical protein
VLDTVHAQYRAARVEADERGITLRHSPPLVKGRMAITPRQTAAIEHVREAAKAPARPTLAAKPTKLPTLSVLTPEEVSHIQKTILRLELAYQDIVDNHPSWDEERDGVCKKVDRKIRLLRQLLEEDQTTYPRPFILV